MSKGRKKGCPVNIRDWDISIQDKSQTDETWVRIKGLEEMTRNTDADTEDGSAATDLWEEPYVTKRNGSLSLSGRPLVDAATGAKDPGQEMLTDYTNYGWCDADATLKLVDPYGHAVVADYVVTSFEEGSDDTDNDVSWDLEQVGEVEALPYVQLTSVAIKDGDTEKTSLSMAVGDTAKVLTVDFTPSGASNKRFRIVNQNKAVASVTNITENSFTVTPLAAGTTNIVVKCVNNGRTATLALTVTASA